MNLYEEFILTIVYMQNKKQDKTSNYESIYTIDKEMSEKGGYQCKINRSNVKLDGKCARKLGDRLMLELGSSIYPIELEVSPDSDILKITNLEGLTQRWNVKTNELIKEHPSPTMQYYIRKGNQNISKQELFIQSLLNDTFFKLYFSNFKKIKNQNCVLLNKWNNFPKQGLQRIMICKSITEKDNVITIAGEAFKITPDINGNSEMIYTLDDKGNISKIQCEIKSVFQQKEYVKNILIERK